MSQTLVTHYAPHDAEPADFAYCGVYVNDAQYHSATPTCPTCAATLAAEEAIDAAVEAMPWPLDADEANAVLDPVLNAGLPAPAARSPLGAQLFNLALEINRAYAAQVRRQRKAGVR
jgi:hypothetical protein